MITKTVTGLDEVPPLVRAELIMAEHDLLKIARTLAYHQPHSEAVREAVAALQEYTDG